MDREEFRAALAGWATGVTIVACRDEGKVIATTVSAFTPLSLDPALVLVALAPNATVRPFLTVGRTFGISVLGAAQRRMASVFADSFPVGSDPFPSHGAPLLPDALIALDCTVERVDTAGDHVLIIARVHAATRATGAPLIRFDRRYHELPE